MKLTKLLLLPIASIIFCGSQSVLAASFQLGDSVLSPFRINGFEAIGHSRLPENAIYTESGITVQQINGDIWTTAGDSLGFQSLSWYAHSGDFGYTKITNEDGSDFYDVSMRTSNGWTAANSAFLNYSLWNDGIEVLSGSALQTILAFPVSFTGGGFDTIYLSATSVGNGSNVSVFGGTFQALALDDIKVSDRDVISTVPLPVSAILFGSGLLTFLGLTKRFSKDV